MQSETTSDNTSRGSASHKKQSYYQRYQAEGYLVCRNLIPHDLIDALLSHYHSKLLKSQQPFFRQNLNQWEGHQLDEYGYAKDGLLDVHDYSHVDSQEFSKLVRKIYAHENILKKLSEITGDPTFSLVQSMFFDRNGATAAHQDCWYLDSVPNGHLEGVWFALEDIDERAGRFYVVRGSHLENFEMTEEETISGDQWLEKFRDYVPANQDRFVSPALKKGDVMFWNSRTVHGATPTKEKKLSRKSLTGHYIPSNYQFGSSRNNQITQVDFFKEGDLLFKHDQHEYSLKRSLRASVFNYVSNKYPKTWKKIESLKNF